MALTPRLDLRQTQSLVMTPQLQQAIKLLQLSNLDLAEYVDKELEQNPLLERDEGGEEGTAGEDGSPENGEARGHDFADGDKGPAADYATVESGEGDPWDGADEGFGGTDRFASWGPGGRADFGTAVPDVEQTLERENSLRDHLLNQLNMDIAEPADRVIGTHLIDMLDEAGYLSGDLSSVAEVLGCDLGRVEATLEKLQRFDPPGIFARSLSECLALQLSDRNRLDPAIQALLDHLDLLARRDMRKLMKVCGVDLDDLTEMVAEVRALNPKPALAFDHSVSQPITPDIFMRPRPGGGWVVELNNETLPRVLINSRYYAQVVQSTNSKAEKDYISECFHSANWLVKSLHQRATTILKVAKEIVRQQDAFFRHGVQFLRPLVLRDIAEAIQMHESTVSRVTTNKYIASPRGMYELKYFFTSAIPASKGGEAHSAEAIRHRIKALIDHEPATAVLSDDKIVEILRTEGVDIARRTVAKYREALRIPSSIARRRRKAAGI